MTLTPLQIKVGRALLGISQGELADSVGVALQTINFIERGANRNVKVDTFERISKFFYSRGLQPSPNGSMEFAPTDTVLKTKGKLGFIAFMKDVAEVAESTDGNIEICVSGVDEKIFQKWCGEYLDSHITRMNKLRDRLRFRIIVQRGDHNRVASSYAEYKS